jgi:hypothetical protein
VSATVAAAVRDAILSQSAVVALLGGNALTARVFASYRDTTGFPCIVLSYGNNADVSPAIDRTDRVRKLDVEIDCVATTAKGALALAEAVRAGLHGCKGTSRNTTIMEIRVINETTSYDVGAEGDEGGYHITSVNVEAYYRSDAVNPSTITTPGQAP